MAISNPGVPLTAPFSDPVEGGYEIDGVDSVDNSYPFYYDPSNASFDPTSGELLSHETDTSLSFEDDPADPCLAGGSGKGCDGFTAPSH
jgi:hypothetical protein